MDKPLSTKGGDGNNFFKKQLASFDTVHTLPRYPRASHNDRSYFIPSKELETGLIGSALNDQNLRDGERG